MDPETPTREDGAAEGDGDARAKSGSELLALVYDELRRVAQVRLQPGETLQATELVHEAWLRISSRRQGVWDGRAHFFGAAAQSMREILVDRARSRSAIKRGGHLSRTSDEVLLELPIGVSQGELLALDEALDELAARGELQARVASLRLFAGLTLLEISEALELPFARVESLWRFARAWLQRRLKD